MWWRVVRAVSFCASLPLSLSLARAWFDYCAMLRRAGEGQKKARGQGKMVPTTFSETPMWIRFQNIEIPHVSGTSTIKLRSVFFGKM